MQRVVIVGGSIAAATAASTLVQEGYDGEIIMLSGESRRPYVRPPLSKGMLSGDETAASIRMTDLPAEVDLRLDSYVVSIDEQTRELTLVDGTRVAYDGLVIATGARARRLLGEAENSHEIVLRDYEDAAKLESLLTDAQRMVIIGGGFLGMEIASTVRKQGLDVTVVDMVPHLERQFGTDLAEILCSAARAKGVQLIRAPEGVKIRPTGEPQGVDLADGRQIDADLVISAVGDIPNIEWLKSTSWATAAGVLIDDRCRVTAGVVAAGDVSVMKDPTNGTMRRSPHWGAAIDQARTAARALLYGDDAEPYKPAPYFWSEQWDYDIKIAGTITPDSKMKVLEGSVEEKSAVVHFQDSEGNMAAASINRRMPIVKLRRLASGTVTV